MKRHIIVEGMDGSGKDTLIGQLMDPKQWRGRMNAFHLHERASTSLGGPMDGLGNWVATDSVRMAQMKPQIYNRHPLISEPIYGEVRPGRPVIPPFNNGPWLSAYRCIVAREAVIVICQPPMPVVMETIRKQGADAHMPGVYENADMLYMAYAGGVWPGTTIRYDYTQRDAFKSLCWTLDKNVGI